MWECEGEKRNEEEEVVARLVAESKREQIRRSLPADIECVPSSTTVLYPLVR